MHQGIDNGTTDVWLKLMRHGGCQPKTHFFVALCCWKLEAFIHTTVLGTEY